MSFYERLLALPAYRKALSKLESLEADRIYCRHDLAHFMDVARIAWIENLEKDLAFDREAIYLTALLHDLGRIAQYRDGSPHDKAGPAMAQELLSAIEYPKELHAPILEAIGAHRQEGSPSPFADLIRRADKASRACFVCPARESCYWSEEKKNKSFER